MEYIQKTDTYVRDHLTLAFTASQTCIVRLTSDHDTSVTNSQELTARLVTADQTIGEERRRNDILSEEVNRLTEELRQTKPLQARVQQQVLEINNLRVAYNEHDAEINSLRATLLDNTVLDESRRQTANASADNLQLLHTNAQLLAANRKWEKGLQYVEGVCQYPWCWH